MKKIVLIFLLLMAIVLASIAFAFGSHDVKTNAIHMVDAPDWVSVQRLDTIVDNIQTLLEWDIHRIEVYWYKDQGVFQKLHGYGSTVLAFSRKSDNTVHVGPKVTTANFDGVFGHELVHIISFQKYHDAIPKWLEEGLANYLSNRGKVDYAWLNRQPPPADVHTLTHPFDGTVDNIRYHYMASQALAEMIASKCDLANLLRLSVKRKLEDKLDTYCGIKDINADYRKWIKSKI